jgi:5-methylcytosine-specific restriction endonuclease McrA
MESIPVKHCTKCNVEKPLECFPYDKHKFDGLRPQCKSCVSVYNTNRYRKTSNRRVRREHVGEGLKRCMSCKRVLPLESFGIRKDHWTGRKSNCNECRLADWHKRRARKLEANGSFTKKEFEAKLKLYKGKCHWCMKPIEGSVHRDHVIPLSRGGSNDISNIVPSCSKCNLSKNDKLPHEWGYRLL